MRGGALRIVGPSGWQFSNQILQLDRRAWTVTGDLKSNRSIQLCLIKLGRNAQHGIEIVKRLARVSLLHGDDSQSVQRIGVVRRDLQSLAVCGLRLSQTICHTKNITDIII